MENEVELSAFELGVGVDEESMEEETETESVASEEGEARDRGCNDGDEDAAETGAEAAWRG